MKQGIPTPQQFACSGLGRWESYHFKDLGFLYYDGKGQKYDLDAQTRADIEQLRRDHLFEHTGR